MDHDKYLIQLKTSLQLAIVEDLDSSIDQLLETISFHSPIRKTLLQIAGKYHDVEKQKMQGTIRISEEDIQLNRVRGHLIELVNELNYPDINTELNEDFKKHLLAYQETQKEVTPIVVESHSVAQETEQIEIASPSEPADSPKTIDDLNLFTEQNKALLRFYPKINRTLRAIAFRNNSKDPNIAKSISTITTHKNHLVNYQSLLKPIEDNLNPIRLSKHGGEFWLLIKKLRAVRYDLTLETIDVVSKNYAALVDFSNRLKQEKLIE